LIETKWSGFTGDFLSQLNIWSFDKKNKTITSGWRTSYIENSTVTYKYINNKWISISTRSSTCDKDRTVQTIITRNLVNGEWIENKEIKKLPHDW
jgi:hypothetical protein